ncbi:uncharacterized protein LOC124938216 [Impatiens glandulifera]|uniref:uncharacterized protein LOC124938216 n=1 Tax=Impatiens glandulifera TaxID=253017 RepID=UPI001FB05BD6|nr:uncharacterized protein LOC124938216 [Impatiens glandulifera]XP_047334573.1 uncharacterized protein LOC124938216 [Impatiens glandulifera]
MEPPPQYTTQRLAFVGSTIEMASRPSHNPDNDRTTGDFRAPLDCNLASLCDHIQQEGFNNGAFYDILVHAMDSTYRLHRFILSRSSYFRNMLHGPWQEAQASIVTLQIDDKNVNGEAIEIALAYLYGHHPKLNDDNAYRVLAAASFLDLQELCSMCTDFIISELWTSNFLIYQTFAENQDYGSHGERVRSACWGYLCQSGAMELKEVLPKLSSQTLHALLISNELWVTSEEKRFELALHTFLAKSALCNAEHPDQGNSCTDVGSNIQLNNSRLKGKNMVDCGVDRKLECELGCLSLKVDIKGSDTLEELTNGIIDSEGSASCAAQQSQQSGPIDSCLEPTHICNVGQISSGESLPYINRVSSPCSYAEVLVSSVASDVVSDFTNLQGQSEGPCYQLNNNNWLDEDQRDGSLLNSSCNSFLPSEWGRYNAPVLSWGGRIVGHRQVKGYAKENSGAMMEEDYDAFVNVFEGGSLLYCNIAFETLLNVRRKLEELGFPCKALNDGLWLKMLLSQRVQEIGQDSCKNCCLVSMACTCRQQFYFSHVATGTNYYVQENDQNNMASNNGNNIYDHSSSQGEAYGPFRPVRAHVRGAVEGLAGIGRGTSSTNLASAAVWPPTRFVFSRVPLGIGNRNCQQSHAHEDSEARADRGGDLTGDGLTALVGLSQGVNNNNNNNTAISHLDHTVRGYEMDLQSRFSGPSVAGTSTSNTAVQMLESLESAIELEWENPENSISLDMKTPLCQFPPFRFAVEFHDVIRLLDGQVKHSPEAFYAGSLWKVSVQAFSDEDPQGRRTLGLFLHRRKADATDSYRKVQMYVDSREKITARYQLICPSKREVLVLGSFKQTGTLLPKAPKGWGWRTAIFFDELGDILQNGALRIAAVVQIL